MNSLKKYSVNFAFCVIDLECNNNLEFRAPDPSKFMVRELCKIYRKMYIFRNIFSCAKEFFYKALQILI